MAQLLANGLVLGAGYALVALGFVLVLNASRAVNFAHGQMVMAGGLLAAVLGKASGLPGLLLLPLVVAALALLGGLVGLVAYRPLLRRPPVATFISTIAVGILIENAALGLASAEPRAAPALLLGLGGIRIGGAVISGQALAVVALSGALGLGLHLAFTRTRLGLRMRAASQDRLLAEAAGIPVDRLSIATFALAAAIAGAAGLMLANSVFVTPTDGGDYVLKAYIAATLGGWGSIPGAILASLLIALFDVLLPALPVLIPGLASLPAGPVLFSQTGAAIALYVVLLAILVLRPRGLFGETAGRRA